MKKDLAYYLKLNYPVLSKREVENGETSYEVEIPDLPGCGAFGKTKQEAEKRLEEAKELWFQTRLKRNLPIPEPISEDEFSGRYLLRIPATLHMQLSINARSKELSLNQYIRKTLESSTTFDSILQEISELKNEIMNLQDKVRSLSTSLSFMEGASVLSAGGLVTTTSQSLGESAGMTWDALKIDALSVAVEKSSVGTS